jgi:leader peptidase (prepilin peptidase)/N-methyltransferase
VPILAWLLLRGRTKCCGTKIPFKFFLLELLSGILLPLVFLSQRNIAQTAVFFTLTACLLVASFIDIDTLELPDTLTVGLAIIGLTVSAVFPETHGTSNVFISVRRSVLGLLCGTGILFWIGVLGEQIFKKEAIGLGDIKLIGAIGTLCGVRGCLCAIFGGSTIGILIILPILVRRFFVPREGGNISVLPFAPFLSLGTILFILFGKSAFLGYLGCISDYARLTFPWA